MKEKAKFTLTFCKCSRLFVTNPTLGLYQCHDCKNEFIRVYSNPDIYMRIKRKGGFNETRLETIGNRRGGWKKS